MKTRTRRSTVERRKSILEHLKNEGQVFVQALSKEFHVSEVAIRNDLQQLEKKNLLVRVRGGAMKVEDGVSFDLGFSEKDKPHREERERIGRKAVELIKEHDTILIDSGTTTMEFAKNLGQKQNITVICNALNIIIQLIQFKNINLIVPGGYLQRNSLSLVGPLANKNLKNLNVDKVIMGVDGFDTRYGIYTPNIEEAYFNEIMINSSREVIVICDSSKFSRRSLVFICGIEKIHYVVTDEGIQEADRKLLEDAGIKVIIS